jgi:hypothetical protein
MKRTLVTVALASAVGLLPAAAPAATVLASAPLKGGAGGLVCSCANLSSEAVVVDVSLRWASGSSICNNLSLSTSAFPRECSLSTQTVRVCVVSRDDGKSASAKHLLCSFASLDGAGNPLAVVPVDMKLKE